MSVRRASLSSSPQSAPLVHEGSSDAPAAKRRRRVSVGANAASLPELNVDTSNAHSPTSFFAPAALTLNTSTPPPVEPPIVITPKANAPRTPRSSAKKSILKRGRTPRGGNRITFHPVTKVQEIPHFMDMRVADAEVDHGPKLRNHKEPHYPLPIFVGKPSEQPLKEPGIASASPAKSPTSPKRIPISISTESDPNSPSFGSRVRELIETLTPTVTAFSPSNLLHNLSSKVFGFFSPSKPSASRAITPSPDVGGSSAPVEPVAPADPVAEPMEVIASESTLFSVGAIDLSVDAGGSAMQAVSPEPAAPESPPRLRSPSPRRPSSSVHATHSSAKQQQHARPHEDEPEASSVAKVTLFQDDGGSARPLLLPTDPALTPRMSTRSRRRSTDTAL